MHLDLNFLWFMILGFLLSGYGVLDGFDLGVGILYLFARKDEDRRVFLNAIGPLWDGNEVWLVTFAGALFAAFPNAYALVLSGFYLVIMCALCAIIFRAVSIEFRSKQHYQWWRAFWDFCFFLSSTSATFLFGVMVGEMFTGMPIGADMEYTGVLVTHFTPFSILTGLFAVATAAMHGSIFLYLKTEGELQKRIQRWMWTSFGVFLTFYIFTTIVTLVFVRQAVNNFLTMPWLWLVVIVNVLAIANIPRAIYLRKPGYAFISSMCVLTALAGLFGAAMYPNIIVSSINPDYSLNIYNAASSQKTLGIMLFIACLGMPFMFAYTAVVYWVFRGKVKVGKFSY